MQIAFGEICNRFDLQLASINSTLDRKHHHRGLIILDESTHETTLQALARDFREIGTRWGTTRNLADVPLFVDSRASRLIQLADHVAYSVYRYYEHDDMTYIKPILSKFHGDEGGPMHGLVHKQTAIGRSCMCHACLSRRTGGPSSRQFD